MTCRRLGGMSKVFVHVYTLHIHIPHHALKKLALLYRDPQEVQIDAFYSLLNNIGELKVWIYEHKDVAFQSLCIYYTGGRRNMSSV